MYWAEGNQDGFIGQSLTDGSDPLRLISGQSSPRGIVIDFEEWRLYWTCVGGGVIRSSSMDGGDMRTIQLAQNSAPQGIAVWGDRIYWSNHFAFKLESIAKDGRDNQTLTTGLFHLYHLAIVSGLTPPVNRTNHCASQSCSGVCVLTDVSFRCLS